MSKQDKKEKEMESNGSMKIDAFEINYSKLYGRGGAFLITPLDKGKVFAREEFTEEHKMFMQTAYEFGENRIFEAPAAESA